MDLLNKIQSLQKNVNLPSKKDLKDSLQAVNKILEEENNLFPINYRPLNSKNHIGGLLDFSDNLTTIIVPDLHARVDFIPALLNYQIEIPLENKKTKLSVYEALQQGLVRIICLGDGLHAERRAKTRWLLAYDDFYYLENEKSEAMEEEMAEGLTTMTMIMECKKAFPFHFHFLKGNHENITNSSDHGNMPFSKFAYEGQMCYQFMKAYYGLPLVASYSRFEKLLPVFVRGKNFLASHAEPIREFSLKEIRDAAIKPDVIYGLTWTKNNESAEGSVEKMLEKFLQEKNCFYFGGHRPVIGVKYNLRANGKFIQIHNPTRQNIGIVLPNTKFNPEIHIVSVV